MKALIFAAGLGTRLKPLTDTMPKAMVPICGKPLLEHTIVRLKKAGVEAIVINVHHFANQIIDFVGANNNFGMQIEFSDERDCLLETGGGIKKAAPFFCDGQPFIVHNVDILSNLDIRAMYDAHCRSDAAITLFASNRPTSRHLLFDAGNNLRAWWNRKTGETKPANLSANDIRDYQALAFNGVHVISPDIFPLMHTWEGRFSIIDFYLSIVQQTRIQAFVYDNCQMIDVGKMDTLAEAESYLFGEASFRMP